jgi:hypothetical protein
MKRWWLVGAGVVAVVGLALFRPPQRAQVNLAIGEKALPGPRGAPEEEDEGVANQAVFIRIKLSGDSATDDERTTIRALSDELERAVAGEEVGDLDRAEFAPGMCTLYVYGPDADQLFSVIEPILRASSLEKQILVIKHYGDPTDLETRQATIKL